MSNELKIEIKITDLNDNVKKFIKDHLNQLIYKEPFLIGCYNYQDQVCKHRGNYDGKCMYIDCPLRITKSEGSD